MNILYQILINYFQLKPKLLLKPQLLLNIDNY